MAGTLRHEPDLTIRDVELVVLLANDMTVKEASIAMGVSESRAYDIVQRVKLELDCATVHAAVLRAFLAGFIARDGEGVRAPWRAAGE